MNWTFEALLEGVAGVKITQGEGATPITSVAIDSRQTAPGGLFIAMKGTVSDGHRYIGDALQRGAAALLVERVPAEVPAEVPLAVMSGGRETAAQVVRRFFDAPDEELSVVGITGTNGKTTVATLLRQAAEQMGTAAGSIGTLGIQWGGRHEPTITTTPDPVTLFGALRRMADAGVRYVFMEVSSHALDQARTAGIGFRGAVFTNISRDHLDYHPSMRDYIFTKKRLFDSLASSAFALLNADDRRWSVMAQNTRAKVHTYGLHAAADFRGRLLAQTMEGLLMMVEGREVHFPLIGAYNASNVMAAYGVLRLLGVEADAALAALSAARGAPGRMEMVRFQPLAVVDYAHTPDALTKALAALAPLKRGKLWVVVGAGGDRDPGKRPMMAQAAVRGADRVILTSDNPRSEDPMHIIQQMLAGVSADQRRRVIVQPDRREAIHMALALAAPDDIILVAGKGHETYQEVAGVRHPFDDRAVIRAWGGGSNA